MTYLEQQIQDRLNVIRRNAGLEVEQSQEQHDLSIWEEAFNEFDLIWGSIELPTTDETRFLQLAN
jgi:hypothetical protein